MFVKEFKCKIYVKLTGNQECFVCLFFFILVCYFFMFVRFFLIFVFISGKIGFPFSWCIHLPFLLSWSRGSRLVSRVLSFFSGLNSGAAMNSVICVDLGMKGSSDNHERI